MSTTNIKNVVLQDLINTTINSLQRTSLNNVPNNVLQPTLNTVLNPLATQLVNNTNQTHLTTLNRADTTRIGVNNPFDLINNNFSSNQILLTMLFVISFDDVFS